MRRKEGREGQRVEKRRSSVRAGSRALFSVGLYSQDATSQRGDYKNSPLEARCLLFATLRLVQTSLPCRKDCWQSRGAGDRDVFLELKSNFSAVSVVSVLLTLQMTSSAARANSSTMQICVFPSAIVLRWSNRRSAVELKELIRSFKLLGKSLVWIILKLGVNNKCQVLQKGAFITNLSRKYTRYLNEWHWETMK